MHIKSLFIIMAAFSTTAQAWQIKEGDISANITQWLMAQQPSPSVYSEMNKYFIETDPTNDAKAYVNHFISSIHTSLVNEADYTLAKKLKEKTCLSEIKVSYPETLTKGFDFESKHTFEEEVIKIQSYDCLGKLDLQKVFETLMSDKFQIETIDGLKSIHSNQETNQVCQEVSISPFGTSNYCFTQHILETPNQIVIHSFNESNINKPTAPAYFRETVTIFTRLKNGEVSVYNLAYARGPDLPLHFVVKSVLTSRQQTSIQNLIERAQ